MAVSDTRNVDQEHVFVNTIYGAPDYALYGSPEENPSESGNSQVQPERSTRQEADEVNRPTRGLNADNCYIESNQYAQLIPNRSKK